MIAIKRTNSTDEDFHRLVNLLDRDLEARNGDEQAFFTQFNKLDKIQHVVVAYADDQPVGCGAFKMYDQQTAEIKRMFVDHSHRGRGIALKILTELEKWAHEVGYRAYILETGIRQKEAVGLYQKAGYTVIPNYGQYVDVASSICMLKKVSI